MSDTPVSLRRKIGVAGELQSVVRTMKALAASNITQYERSVRALTGYYHAVELGLSACLRESGLVFINEPPQTAAAGVIGAIVFGSDQGLVGRFNEVVVDYAVETLSAFPVKPVIWAIGEHAYGRLVDVGLPPIGLLSVPNSVKTFTPLIGQILLEYEKSSSHGELSELFIFYNQPASGALYTSVSRRLLPLDINWRRSLAKLPWPTHNLPEVMGSGTTALQAFIREYLFVSLFQACAESLESENASRLAAMRRADKNIEEMLEELTWTYHRLRQSSIDEELFDVIAGFEAQSSEGK